MQLGHSVLFIGGVAVFMALCCYAIYRKRKQLGITSPVGEKMLRPAGYSLRKRMESLDETLMLFPLSGFFLPVLIGLSPIVLFKEQLSHLNAASVITVFVICLIVLLAGWGIGFVLTYKRLNYWLDCSLGLKGEELVAQHLNPLFGKDYRIYHDFPIEGRREAANIDHIVIGANGVFVIETKMRRKHKKVRTKQESHKVEYNGDELIYPSYRDRHGLGQTEANSKHLEEFLWTKTNKRIPVTGILTIPGWYVTQTGYGKVLVRSHKTLEKTILASKGSIDRDAFRSAVIAVREACCDVEI